MRGQPVVIVASASEDSNSIVVVGRRDRGITLPQDLIGKSIGLSVGTAADYFLWAFLIRNKLPAVGHRIVDLPPDQLAAALAAGKVDAVVAWQPELASVQTVVRSNGRTFAAPGVYSLNVCLAATVAFVTGHRGTIEKMLRALLKAETHNRTHPEASLRLVALRLGTTEEILRPVWAGIDFSINLLQSQLITFEDEARWAVARGLVDPQPVPNLLPYLYLDPLLAVAAGKVTVLHQETLNLRSQ
jgi:NitT/TauT family transport system substrate-binding protein